MYLSAERIEVANRAIAETFEQTCVVWQSIPHWETGDPSQTKVRSDNLSVSAVPIESAAVDVTITLAEGMAPTPDGLLTKVMAGAVELAAAVDGAALPALRGSVSSQATVVLPNAQPQSIVNALIDARAALERAGCRSPSCMFTPTEGMKGLNQLVGGSTSVKAAMLDAGNINSLHRVETLAISVHDTPSVWAVVLGRRQRIAHATAMDASPGEEPVDLAISEPPGLEVIGDTADNLIQLRVRIRYALRVKAVGGLVAIVAS